VVSPFVLVAFVNSCSLLLVKCTYVLVPTGKSTFLKALSNQLNKNSGHLDGDILFNGDPVSSGKYLVGKVASYVDERDQHAATLTVRETFEFAWKVTTGGHHAYGVAKDEEAAEILNRGDKDLVKVNAIPLILLLFFRHVSPP
jgi:ABC-type multidrug transport system ATPase subunit